MRCSRCNGVGTTQFTRPKRVCELCKGTGMRPSVGQEVIRKAPDDMVHPALRRTMR